MYEEHIHYEYILKYIRILLRALSLSDYHTSVMKINRCRLYNNISLETNLVAITRTRDAVQNRCWQTGLVVNGSRVQRYRCCPR